MTCIGRRFIMSALTKVLVQRVDNTIAVQVAALPCMADDTVFALHMAHGTNIEVPDPDKSIKPDGTKRYRCRSDSDGKPQPEWLSG